MLTEQRYEQILKLLDQKRSVTVTELRDLLQASESTVRRDITALHRAGRLTKVFGGAVALEGLYVSQEPTVAQKIDVNRQEKEAIARYAASLIVPEDFVYLDAGTTTGYMIEYITQKNATYVTNAVSHAQSLAKEGYNVLLIGGELKAATEAVVGNQALRSLESYHFTKGFFGANGLSKKAGCTTPDANEALIKQMALEHAKERYVLADGSKFGNISSVTFAPYSAVTVITEARPQEPYANDQNIIVVQNEA